MHLELLPPDVLSQVVDRCSRPAQARLRLTCKAGDAAVCPKITHLMLTPQNVPDVTRGREGGCQEGSLRPGRLPNVTALDFVYWDQHDHPDITWDDQLEILERWLKQSAEGLQGVTEVDLDGGDVNADVLKALFQELPNLSRLSSLMHMGSTQLEDCLSYAPSLTALDLEVVYPGDYETLAALRSLRELSAGSATCRFDQAAQLGDQVTKLSVGKCYGKGITK